MRSSGSRPEREFAPRHADDLLETAEPTKNDTLIDAYCGVGTLSLLAANQVKKVIGIENEPQSINDAIHNAKLNKLTNAEFIMGKVEEKLAKIDNADILILNPPRQGCQPIVLDTINSMQPKTIIYVSCDPATLARDLGKLTPNYCIDNIKPFDMFPQTMHVETVVRLKLQK